MTTVHCLPWLAAHVSRIEGMYVGETWWFLNSGRYEVDTRNAYKF
jgi:hypothetical protein